MNPTGTSVPGPESYKRKLAVTSRISDFDVEWTRFLVETPRVLSNAHPQKTFQCLEVIDRTDVTFGILPSIPACCSRSATSLLVIITPLVKLPNLKQEGHQEGSIPESKTIPCFSAVSRAIRTNNATT